MLTTLGTVVLELDPFKAPISTANLLAYVNDGFYNGVIFHRVIANRDPFVAQTGGYASGLIYKASTYDPIFLESANSLSNVRGTLGMARIDVPNSATSQFYINLRDNTFLDYAGASRPGYAIFGDLLFQLLIGSVPGIVVGSLMAQRLAHRALQLVLALVLFGVGSQVVLPLFTGSQ